MDEVSTPLQILAQTMERNNFKIHQACSEKYFKVEQIMTYSSLAVSTTSSVTEKRLQTLDVEFNEMIPPTTPALKVLSSFKKTPHLVFSFLSRQD